MSSSNDNAFTGILEFPPNCPLFTRSIRGNGWMINLTEAGDWRWVKEDAATPLRQIIASAAEWGWRNEEERLRFDDNDTSGPEWDHAIKQIDAWARWGKGDEMDEDEAEKWQQIAEERANRIKGLEAEIVTKDFEIQNLNENLQDARDQWGETTATEMQKLKTLVLNQQMRIKELQRDRDYAITRMREAEHRDGKPRTWGEQDKEIPLLGKELEETRKTISDLHNEMRKANEYNDELWKENLELRAICGKTKSRWRIFPTPEIPQESS